MAPFETNGIEISTKSISMHNKGQYKTPTQESTRASCFANKTAHNYSIKKQQNNQDDIRAISARAVEQHTMIETTIKTMKTVTCKSINTKTAKRH